MARKVGRGKNDLVSLQEKQLKGQEELESLRALLAQKEKEQRELEQQVESETIRSLGEEVQPFVVRFNKSNLSIFEFLKDACGAIERGEAVVISGHEYKSSRPASFGTDTSSMSEEDEEEDV